MATIGNDPNGFKRILFVAPDGKRKTIRLGKATMKQATAFKVKVEAVRTSNFEGKLRRRGRFAGYRSDWKKAYVKLKAGEKVPEFTDL